MALNPTSTKVLVTGAKGFIGLHTVMHFLKRGYNLCATVRTQEQGEKVRQTIAKHTATNRLEFVQADLTKDEGWEQAVVGCDFVLRAWFRNTYDCGNGPLSLFIQETGLRQSLLF